MKTKKTISLFLALTFCLTAGQIATAREAEKNQYPVKFDLRQYGVVTPVKFQNPWQTCWAFGGITAAESSILSTLGLTAEEFKEKYGEDFDLSEKHLAWYALHPVTADINETQAGEGMILTDAETNPQAAYDAGGKPIYISTLFSSGVGPVFEKHYPYHGTKAITELEFYRDYPDDAKAYERSVIESTLGMTVEEAVEVANKDAEKKEEAFGKFFENGYLDKNKALTADAVVDAAYGYMLDKIKERTGMYYTSHDDWTIPELDENGHPNRAVYAGFTLTDGNQLPSLSIKDDEGNWKAINNTGIRAVKSELMKGRGVTIAFHADQSKPGEEVSEEGFLNLKTWAQYTDVEAPINHGVCIIGWDDSYSKENFNEGHQPPGDGAWIVKNSWGSENEYKTSPNGEIIGKKDWGIVDKNGNHTGYFYLSYYDKGVMSPETLVFDTDLDNDNGMGVWMYDYMPSILDSTMKTESIGVIKTANVFTNDSGEDVKLRGVSTKTSSQRAKVVYSIYRLNENSANPEDGEFLGKRVAYHEYAGFHRLPLRGDLTIKDGDRIAVVVEESVVNKDGNKVYQYTVNAGLGKPLADELDLPFYGKAVVNHGESYLYENGKWTDWADHKLTYSDALKESFEEEDITVVNNDNVNDMLAVDNFSIKMYVTQ